MISQVKKRVRAAGIIAAIITVMTNICAYAESNVHVKLDGLKRDNEAEIVDFEYAAPTNTDGISMVPIRNACEAAGMSVMWQENLDAVVVTLNANQNSLLPIERHAFDILKKKANYEENDLEPAQIIMTMYLDSEEATLHYNYKTEQNETASYGRYIYLPKPVKMAENGVLAAPLRPMFNYFGLWLDWEEETNTVSIEIPMFISFIADMERLAVYEPKAEDGLEMPSEAPEATDRIYLGNFRISHYCSCQKCCGAYAGETAWGGPLRADYTIAVDPTVIPKLASIEIDGYDGIRIAEDCGGAIKGNRIDVAVSSHEEAMRLGVVYRDVWLVN